MKGPQLVRLPPQPLREGGARGELEGGVADQRRRGLVPGDEDQHHHLDHLVVAEPRPLVLRLHETGEEIVLRAARALLRQRNQVGAHRVEEPPLALGPLAVEAAEEDEPEARHGFVRPGLEAPAVLRRHADDLRDHRHGKRVGEGLDQIDLALRHRVRDQLAGDLAHARLQAPHDARREGLVHQAAQARVHLAVGAQHARRRQVVARELRELPVQGEGVREADVVAEDRLHVGVAEHRRDAEGEAFVQVHRVLGAPPRKEGVGIAAHLRVEGAEGEGLAHRVSRTASACSRRIRRISSMVSGLPWAEWLERTTSSDSTPSMWALS